MNFKIRVVENIGEDSIKSFGVPGTVHNVCYGKIVGDDDSSWTNDGKYYENIQEVNNHLGNRYRVEEWQTLFELVEEESNDKE